jgi:hypothetical protein
VIIVKLIIFSYLRFSNEWVEKHIYGKVLSCLYNISGMGPDVGDFPDAFMGLGKRDCTPMGVYAHS